MDPIAEVNEIGERRGSTRDFNASTLRIGSVAESHDKENNSLPKTLLEWKLLRRFKGDESRVIQIDS